MRGSQSRRQRALSARWSKNWQNRLCLRTATAIPSGFTNLVEHVSASWFSGRMGDWYGAALLFRVLGPNHVGEHVALTPRTQMAIEDQLRWRGVASVIVHRFDCDLATLQEGASCESTAIGMTVLRRQNDAPRAE